MACSPPTPRRSTRISWNSLRDEVRTRADCARIDHVVSQRGRIALAANLNYARCISAHASAPFGTSRILGDVRFVRWSQAVDATLYFRRKRWNGRAMGRRYVRGFNTVAKEELWNPLALRIRSSTEWLGNSMNGGVRLWASKPEPNEI